MSEDRSAAQRRLEQTFDEAFSAVEQTGSNQPTLPAGVPTVLGPYARALAGSPATRLVGQPTTSEVGQSPSAAYPGLSSVGAQPFSVRLGGMAEASHQTPNARVDQSPMRLGGQPPTNSIKDQATHLVQLPDSPPDAAMAITVYGGAEDRLAEVMPARAKARTFLSRSDPSPEPRQPPGPLRANQDGEIQLLRQQLLESHTRAGMLSNYVAQAMGMMQEREAWWRNAANASFEERAVLMQQAQAQEATLLGRVTQMGQALQHYSTDATLSEAQRIEQARIIANLQIYSQDCTWQARSSRSSINGTFLWQRPRLSRCCSKPLLSTRP